MRAQQKRHNDDDEMDNISGPGQGAAGILRFDALETRIALCNSRKHLFRNAQFRQELFTKLDRLMPPAAILSLDVFDTVLLRDGSSELTRFLEIGEKMAQILVASNSSSMRFTGVTDAFLARHLGTTASYRASGARNGCREGSLTEIHETASKILTGDTQLSKLFIDAELEYESSRLSRNDLLMEYIFKHRAGGGQVILISDMYMHGDQISSLLSRLGVSSQCYDHIFSSADVKVSKASGGIFGLIETAMAARPGDFLHVGDSLNGDFRQPISHGWKALHMPIPDAELAMRRDDHLATADKLKRTHGLTVEIAMPH